jgi:hypothetical protein
VALVRSPFAAELLTDAEGLLVVSTPDGSGTKDDRLRLASLPCVVVAAEPAPPDTLVLADVAPEPGVAAVDDLIAAIEARPLAATTLALCLRQGTWSLDQGLVAESAAFSVLQAGPEFAAWRSGRPVKTSGSEEGPAVRLERSGDRLEIVLARPAARNALNMAVRDGLLEALTLVAAVPALAPVVLRGEGTNFCSGGDLNEFGQFVDPASAHLVRLMTSIGRAIDKVRDRLTVEVHGACAGSGVELAAFAGHVVARPDFTAVLPEVGLGLIPGAGGTVSITRRIGRHRMALLGFSGATIGAQTALAWGLVDRIAE